MKKRIWWSLFSAALLSLSVLCCPPSAFAADALSVSKLLFVDNVTGLSQYTPKQGARFAIGDICTVYIEITGFALNPADPDSEDEFALDLAVDLTIRMPQRRRAIIVSEKDFNTLSTTVRSKLNTTFTAFSFLFDEDWDTGDYVIELTLRDNISGQSVTQAMNYKLEEPTEADLTRQAEQNKNRPSEPQ